MDVELIRVYDDAGKISIMRRCDGAFPIRLFERPNCDEVIQRILEHACFYAAFMGVLPIGYVAFYANDMDGKRAYISSIGVGLEYQRNHIGSLLMGKCLEVAADRGMSMVRLEVLATNEKAIAF